MQQVNTKTLKFDCGCSCEVIDEDSEIGFPRLIIDIRNIPLDCQATWDLICSGAVKGIFQLEGHLGPIWSVKLKPRSIQELSDVGALVRPGCMRAKSGDPPKSMTERYCDRKAGLEPVSYLVPALEPIMKDTYGVLTYQEQSMKIAQTLAGFDLKEADTLRKAIGKKKPEIMAQMETKFLEGCKKVGLVTNEQAEEIFGWIKKSELYSFNKCFSADTVIRRPNGGKFLKKAYTVEEMYLIRNDIEYAKKTGHYQLRFKWKRLGHYGYGLSLCDDGRIRPNKIIDIKQAGVKPIYRIVLLNGYSVEVSGNHKFPTAFGELRADELQVGNKLICCGQYEPTNKNYAFSSVTKNELKENSCDKEVFKAFGESNYGYTNGSFTEFRKNDKLIPKECNKCGKTSGRLELHHKDGNRSDSSLSNLERLCSSCHKKAEYQAGRRKRGEKGYPHTESEIVSIEIAGERMTYDVTMAAPNHNLLVNDGVIASNSHSISYAKNGYWSAWCKAHFLIPFYKEYLKGAEMKQSTFDEVFELVMDAKRAGVEIMPPDLRDCRPQFYIKDNAIYFGLSNIKGVGEKAVETLLEVIKTTETEDTYPAREWNWWYFLYRVTPKIRSDAARALISAGALDYLGPERNRMLFEFKIFESLTPGEKKWIGANASRFNSLEEALFVCSGMSGEKGGCNGDKKRELMRGAVQQLQKPPHSLSDTAAWKSWTEQKLLGVAVTCNKVDDCDTASEANATCKDFVDGRDGFMTFAVQIVKVKVVVTKNGKNPGQKMAFISILDQTCSVEAVVFPDTYKKHMGDIQEGNTVFLHAEKDKKRGGLVVKKVTSI